MELKAGEFKPEYAGKSNFYLSAIDDMLKHETDNPSIGIMICKERDKLTAEYALKDINKPISVSKYKLSDFVPNELADTLPSAEDIEKCIKERCRLKKDKIIFANIYVNGDDFENIPAGFTDHAILITDINTTV